MNASADPIGEALKDYISGNLQAEILVESDLCDDDVIPLEWLTRKLNQMPDLEKKALDLCKGSILDIGAGAGCHALELASRSMDVSAIDISSGCIEYLNKKNIRTIHADIWSYQDKQYDTLLLLMNGIGLAGKIDQLPAFLIHLKSLLKPGGTVICESTDLAYLFMDEDGSMLLDLNDRYYGEMKFNMRYKNHETGWFEWLYIDHENLTACAEIAGFHTEIIYTGENMQYLALLKIH
ncbi:MAG: class I SAM-dependent methyltransferase [Crocinitomicaceae bacterium]|nr:class I SAM-dependent methyltransferase [Crocinitomicaceae bacterium]